MDRRRTSHDPVREDDIEFDVPAERTYSHTHIPTHKVDRVAWSGPGGPGVSECRLCPRRCGVDRLSGQIGFCGAGARPKIYTFGPHHGEEPPLSGTRGSGTVFFSCCTLACIYCQNYRWSQNRDGAEHDVPGLAAILRELADLRCHNWNLVSPTPWIPFIAEALELLDHDGVSLPVVYNTSGFETGGMIDSLSGIVDVYLVDLRYASPETAATASGSKHYVQVARDAVAKMWNQVGPVVLDDDGTARRGTICRLLVLPGHAVESIDNLRWLKREIGTELAISLMAQYSPAHLAVDMLPWNRRVTQEEYELVRAEAEELGFGNGWIQDYEFPVRNELAGMNFGPRALAGTCKES
jgi:putative pyruvate formate lyase activating enzyme